MTLKIAARKCLVWERCSSGGSASGAQASLLVRCRSCPEQQDQACTTMSPLLGSTSSDCKTTSYSGFLFLRMTGPKAFFFFFFLIIQNVEDHQKFWKNPFTMVWLSFGSQEHFWPLDPEVEMSTWGWSSPGLWLERWMGLWDTGIPRSPALSAVGSLRRPPSLQDSRKPFDIKKLVSGLPWWPRGWESTRQCRGYRFDPWSGKIPHALGQRSLCTQLLSLCPRAWGPQQLRLRTATAGACVPESTRSATREAIAVKDPCTATGVAPVLGN